MRIFQFALTVLLTYILVLFLPFWSVAIAAFVVAFFISKGSWISFLIGFLSIAIFWLLSAWIKSNGINNSITDRVAAIFTLSPILLMIITALLGGLIGGFAAASGTQLSRIVFGKKRRRNPYRQ